MTEKINTKQLKSVSTDGNLGTSDVLLPTQKAVKTYVDTAAGVLQDEIDNLKGLGRFLSVWNCATGLAETNPPESPYTYHSGDYFLVGTVDSTTNYKPNGSTYTTGVASTTVETAEVKVNDVYIYDGTNWKLQANSQREYTFSGIIGSPYDNTNLTNALNDKVDETSTANQVYGTDVNGDQTTYNTTDFGAVDDVKVNNVSVVTSKVANIDLTTYVQNTATGTDSLTMLGTAAASTNALNAGKGAGASGNNAVALGNYASAEGEGSISIGGDSSTTYRARTTHKGNIAIGHDAYAINDKNSIAIGESAHANGKNIIQLGTGNNTTNNSFQVMSYKLLDTSTGLIPDTRISTNIARITDLPTTLISLTGDVAVSSPSDGQHLVYDANIQKWKNITSAASVSWGGVTGTLSDQTDLQNALDAKSGCILRRW